VSFGAELNQFVRRAAGDYRRIIHQPFIIPNQIDIWQAASAPESLMFILYGAIVVLPAIILYTFFLSGVLG
jgi:cytochrome bd-type quinol oxidase subunit 2